MKHIFIFIMLVILATLQSCDTTTCKPMRVYHMDTKNVCIHHLDTSFRIGDTIKMDCGHIRSKRSVIIR